MNNHGSQRLSFTKTHPVCNSFGVRKAPCPSGRAGYVPIDSVHQGKEDGMEGGYHITCVDSISQWQIEACVQGISEAFLLSVLEMVIEQFPFFVAGFHSDSGSEYINHKVAKLMEKLRIEQTKSRSRQSNDNALGESKNAGVVKAHGLRAYSQKACITDRYFLPEILQPVAQFAPALHVCGQQSQRQRQGREGLQTRRCGDPFGGTPCHPAKNTRASKD